MTLWICRLHTILIYLEKFCKKKSKAVQYEVERKQLRCLSHFYEITAFGFVYDFIIIYICKNKYIYALNLTEIDV